MLTIEIARTTATRATVAACFATRGTTEYAALIDNPTNRYMNGATMTARAASGVFDVRICVPANGTNNMLHQSAVARQRSRLSPSPKRKSSPVAVSRMDLPGGL